MSAPIPSKQKKARKSLDELNADSKNVWVVHYSCESFYDRKDGMSPRITSIAVRRLSDGQTKSFSIHQVAERKKVIGPSIEKKYDVLEKQMLAEFFKFVATHSTSKFLHWNMRDSNYGFQAMEHRMNVLGGKPNSVADENKFDLARLLIEIYGVGYIGHPRLEKLLEKNSIKALDFLTGAQEAAAFEKKDYVALHQSTLRKVDVMANVFERAHARQLLTNTSRWEMHGGSFKTAIDYIAANKSLALLLAILGLAVSIWGLS
jgi:hypothetical protein